MYVLSSCEVYVYRFRLLGGVNFFSVSLSSTYCVSCGLCLVLGFFGGGGDFFLSCDLFGGGNWSSSSGVWFSSSTVMESLWLEIGLDVGWEYCIEDFGWSCWNDVVWFW